MKGLVKLRKKAENQAKKLRSVKGRAACLEMSHTCNDPLVVTGDQFDKKPLTVACLNRVIDLRSGADRAGRPRDYILKASPHKWVSFEERPLQFEKTVSEVFNNDKEMADYFQRVCGYALTGSCLEKIIVILFGPRGWTGRSTIVEAIMYAAGPLAGVVPSEMFLSTKYAKSSSSPSPDLMSLRGLRFACSSEIDEGQRFSAARCKWLSGNDTIVARSPHDRHVTRFQPTHTLFLMTNTLPAAPPNDRAFWERLHVIPFDISFVNRTPRESFERRANLKLKQQLRKEASGILSWLVRGALLYQKHGLNPPRKVTEVTEQYRRDEDLLFDFLDECCLVEPGAKERASVLYGRFVEWYHANCGTKEPSGHWFGRNLSQKFEKSKINGVICYHGIALA